jgi:hypothetical protein
MFTHLVMMTTQSSADMSIPPRLGLFYNSSGSVIPWQNPVFRYPTNYNRLPCFVQTDHLLQCLQNDQLVHWSLDTETVRQLASMYKESNNVKMLLNEQRIEERSAEYMLLWM